MSGIDGEDLTEEALQQVLPGRALRSYPAVASTEADALAWARSGGPSGALVVAAYQAAPSGRAGIPWKVRPGRSLGFSLLLRPQLPAEREGWPYVVALAALADVVADAAITWPDTVRGAQGLAAQIALQSEVGAEGVRWAVLSCLLSDALPPRGPLLALAVDAIESWSRRGVEEVLDAARRRCETLGRRVRARIVPMGPRGIVIEGIATDLTSEGSLVVETAAGSHRAVRPQDLGLLDVE